LLGGAIGAGAVLAIAGIGTTAYSLSHRVKPWNRAAVTSEYGSLSTEGSDHTLVFRYVLINNTDQDYRVDDVSTVQIAGKLKSQNSLVFGLSGFEKADSPIYVPARSRVRMSIHANLRYTSGEPSSDADAAWRDYQLQLARFASKEMPNLGGYVVFDPTTH
jgi:hypothetical protein